MIIYSVEIFNLGTSAMHPGQPVPKGCLGVVVDKCSFDIYHELPDGVFYSECDGLLSIFRHSPGTKDGFGGREISLPIIEPSVAFPRKSARRIKVFKGSLWSSASASSVVERHLGTTITSIGVRDSNDRYKVYSSVRATREFMDRISRVVILGEAESSPLL